MSEKKIQPHKVSAVSALSERIAEFPNILIADYRGLKVSETTELRRSLRESGSELSIVRNTFARIALKDIKGTEGINDLLKGPTAIVFTKEEAPRAAKVIVDFAKEHPIELRGGFVEGQLMSTKEVNALSKLPSRLELLAGIVGLLQSPAQNIVGIIESSASDIAGSVEAIVESKK